MDLSDNPTDDEILALVQWWIDDLARGDYATAYARTAQDPYYQWTPELMQAVVAGYGSPVPHRSGVVFRVTPRDTAVGRLHYRTVDRDTARPPGFVQVWHDLPLNGKWS